MALIVPEQFNLNALEKAKGTKGFGVEAGLSYFQNLIELIRIAQGAKNIGVEATGSAAEEASNSSLDWGLGHLDYEIIR